MIQYNQLTKTTPPCPLCNGTQFQQLAANDRYGMGIKTAGCLGCGLVQTWPRPSPEAMSDFYRNHYREYYQSASTPDTEYINRYHKGERLKYTASLIAENVGLSAGMRILDIGCAEGTLIANLKAINPELVCYGVEPSESFSAYARKTTGCTTFPDIESLSRANESNFDLIIINHVLEHVDNPVQFLNQLREFLVVGGKIYIDVPDVEKYAIPQHLHIAHLFHFSQRTLPASIEKAGLNVLKTVPHSPPHHPFSIWCIAEKRGVQATADIRSMNSNSESEAWNRIKRIDQAIPLYLFKVALLKNKVVSALHKAISKK